MKQQFLELLMVIVYVFSLAACIIAINIKRNKSNREIAKEGRSRYFSRLFNVKETLTSWKYFPDIVKLFQV